MEALFLVLAALNGLAVISEVCANPPVDTCGEFVEIWNNSPDTLNVLGFTITDGDALDGLFGWSGVFPQGDVITETTLIPPWGYAVLLEEDYPGDPWLTFQPGTVILTTSDHAICNGLAASSDPLTLFDSSGTSPASVLSTFGTPLNGENWQQRDDNGQDSIPFDPGTGLTLFRYPQNMPDCEMAWFAGEPTPGGPPDAPPDTFLITTDSLFLSNPDPDPGTGVWLTATVSCWGTVTPSGSICLFIDANGDSTAQASELLLSIPAEGLAPGTTDTLSVFFTAPPQGWYPAVCETPTGETRLHFTTGGGVNPRITEVMANPVIETEEEFIEVFYPGPGVFPLTGCHFTDGDATDDILHHSGSEYISPGQAALIIDPDYQGTLSIPENTPLFVPGNTTLGNGLTTTDPILLYRHGEPSLETLLSTAGTPLLFNDPLMCDDDGLDSIPFDPGDGHSMERILPTGPDAQFNWRSSVFGGTPGTVPQGQEWADLATDSITVQTGVKAWFSNCGVLPAQGLATIFFDANGNLLPEPPEVIHQTTLTLLQGQSDSVSVPFTPPDSGLFTIAAIIQCPSDTITGNNSKYAHLIPAKPAWPVVTEVLPNPSSQSTDEVVEVYFPGPGQVDITCFTITDYDSEDILVAVETPFLVQGQYGLVMDPDYSQGSMPYDIPPGTVLIHPGNSTIGNGLSGNDPVGLLFLGGEVSTYGTPFDETDGIPVNPGTDLSMERITPFLPDSESSWFISPFGPTPGAPPENITQGVDYSVASITAHPPMGAAGTETLISAMYTSLGTDSVPQGDLNVSISANGSPVHTATPAIPGLGDTLMVNFIWVSSENGTELSATCHSPEDANGANDTALCPWNPAPAVVINEVFRHEPEWIEILNGTDQPVSLSSLVFSDATNSTELPSGTLEPGEFALFTENIDLFRSYWGDPPCQLYQPENWPTLNNGGDTLHLATKEEPLDMVPYTTAWGGNSASSLERRSSGVMGFIPENWGTCIEGATPGRENSIGETAGGTFLTMSPTVFNPPATPLSIHINLPMQACDVTVKVYDVRGMELERLYENTVPGETLVLEWSGSGYPVGRYIIYAEAFAGGNILSDAGVVVLARPLN